MDRDVKDNGCKMLADYLGHPVTCLECPLDKCLEDFGEGSKYRIRMMKEQYLTQCKERGIIALDN